MKYIVTYCTILFKILYTRKLHNFFHLVIFNEFSQCFSLITKTSYIFLHIVRCFSNLWLVIVERKSFSFAPINGDILVFILFTHKFTYQARYHTASFWILVYKRKKQRTYVLMRKLLNVLRFSIFFYECLITWLRKKKLVKIGNFFPLFCERLKIKKKNNHCHRHFAT